MWGAHTTECVFSKVHFTGSHILCKKHYDEKSQESQLRHVVQDVMQWQKTAHSLQAKSGGKHLRRHFRQHMVHWLIRQWCLYLLAWVQLFCLSTAGTDSLSCQWVAFNACKVLCLRLTFMKYKQFMDYPNQFFKAPFCARAGREWYSTFSAILCHRRMASTWQILSSLHLLCDTTWWSCLSIFTAKKDSLRVWPKLELPGVLCSKPREDLAMIMHLVWHSGGCSLLLLSLWQLLPAPCLHLIWLDFQQVHAFVLRLKTGTKGLSGLPSVLRGLRQHHCHEQCHYPTLTGQKCDEELRGKDRNYTRKYSKSSNGENQR